MYDSLPDTKIYGAWSLDNNIVAATTSGGIADILARALTHNGWTCVGVEYDTDSNIAKHSIANTAKETEKFRGSKYIQSYSADGLKTAIEQLRLNKKLVVFGTPCQIYAFNRYLERNKLRDKCLLVDLYCHGCPTLNAWQKFIKELLSSLPGKEKQIISVNFRSKVKGWGNFYVVVVVVVDGIKHVIKSRPYNNAFYDLFFSDTVLNEACYDCKLRSTLNYTDIRLGDFWGKEYVNNSHGVSAVTICTQQGQYAFQEIQPDVCIEEQAFPKFLPYQSYGKNYMMPSALRAVLLKQLADKNVSLPHSIATIYQSKSIIGKIKWHLKHISQFIPNRILSLIKKIYYNL